MTGSPPPAWKIRTSTIPRITISFPRAFPTIRFTPRDENYLKTLRALPSHLRRAFLDGDWDVFAGQYFDRFDYSRHVVRAEANRLEAVVAALDLD